MNAHTPGPWEAFDDEIVARDDQRVADVPLVDGINPTEWQANARLIAAAPELLAACKSALGWYGLDGDGISDPTLKQVREAIQKADGQS